MGAPECPGCRTRDVRIAALENEVRQLRDELRQLKALLGRHAGNSSLPPSANPPAAPPPVQKPKSERRPGAQPGHPPHLKQLLPPERVTRTVTFVPSHCDHCQTPLPRQAGPDDPAPTRFQVADLPPVRAEVIEYQGHGRGCPACGHVTWRAIPADRCQHSIGPGLAAATSYLAGCHQVSKRGLEEIVEVLFEVPVALGTIANLEQEMSQALAAAHAEAVAAVQQAPGKHADETGWKKQGTLRRYIDEQRPWLRDLLARGRVSGCAKTAGLCKQLQELEPALWTFVRQEGVEPTNNHAERVLRKAVLWRKKSFGCASEGGCRFVERILTVVQTLRLQSRQVCHFFQQSVAAHGSYQSASSFLSASTFS